MNNLQNKKELKSIKSKHNLMQKNLKQILETSMTDIAELIALKREMELYIKQKKVEQESLVLAIRKEYLLKDKLETEVKSHCDITDRLTK